MVESSENRRSQPDRIVAWLSNGGVEGAQQIEQFHDYILCEPNDPAKFAFYVQRGQVRIHHFSADNMERFSAILGPNEWVGVASIAAKAKYGIRARAIAKSLIWQIPAVPLVSALASTPEIAAIMVTQLAARLLQASDEASRLVFQGVDQRILLTLLDFGKSAAAIAHAEEVTLQITHEELAQAVGAARETVGGALTALRKRNLIHTSRKRVSFNRQALREFAAAQVHGHATSASWITPPGAGK